MIPVGPPGPTKIPRCAEAPSPLSLLGSPIGAGPITPVGPPGPTNTPVFCCGPIFPMGPGPTRIGLLRSDMSKLAPNNSSFMLEDGYRPSIMLSWPCPGPKSSCAIELGGAGNGPATFCLPGNSVGRSSFISLKNSGNFKNKPSRDAEFFSSYRLQQICKMTSPVLR